MVQKSTLGERETAQRLKIAIDRAGGNAYLFIYKAKLGRYKLTAFVVKMINKILAMYFRPEFIITLYPSIYPVIPNNIPKYLFITKNMKDRMLAISKQENRMKFFDDYQWIGDYDGYLDVTANNNKSFLNDFDLDKFSRVLQPKERSITYGYPTVYATKYSPPSKREVLFYCGGNWDKLRSSKKYTKLVTNLEKANYIHVYGPATSWNFLQHSYKGFIPNDGTSLISVMREAGISLLLHSDEHNKFGIPTGRIFEAAAAGTVIISDHNAFVKQHFKDNVLYIDISLSAEKMFLQINRHMQWIQANASEANRMAKNCHSIFIKKFLLEDMILNLCAQTRSLKT